jgi:hypothetical protein
MSSLKSIRNQYPAILTDTDIPSRSPFKIIYFKFSQTIHLILFMKYPIVFFMSFFHVIKTRTASDVQKVLKSSDKIIRELSIPASKFCRCAILEWIARSGHRPSTVYRVLLWSAKMISALLHSLKSRAS